MKPRRAQLTSRQYEETLPEAKNWSQDEQMPIANE